MNKFNLETKHPGAFDSQDHLNPVGSLNDNYTNINLIKEVCSFFNRKISVLDLGCAGGQLIVDFTRIGNDGVGIEGSTHALHGPGKNNWLDQNNNLFICDITKPFTITRESKDSKFDFIHCSEVLEHISLSDLEICLNNVYKHLSDDGVFCCQISIDKSDPLHVSVFSKEKWINIFSSNGFEICEGKEDSHHIGYLFNNRFRDHIVMNLDGSINYGTSLYFCLKKHKL